MIYKGSAARVIGLILSAVLFHSTAISAVADYEVTPLVGLVWPEGNLQLKRERVVGVALQYNEFIDILKPEIVVLFTPRADFKPTGAGTTITRFMVSGVHEYRAWGAGIPFVKAGLGYEFLSKNRYDNEDSAMVGTGAGLKMPMSDSIALKLEALYMLKYNANRWDSNLAGLVGIALSFGRPEPSATVFAPLPDHDDDGVSDGRDFCPGTPDGVSVDIRGCETDGDGDGVVDRLDHCPKTRMGVEIDANGCELDGDGDGVVDRLDRCPQTPARTLVDAQGCPVVTSFEVSFAFASAEVGREARSRLKAFAVYMNEERPMATVKIIGHTDSTGTALFNLKLSKQRAEQVKSILVEYGVAPHRLLASGRGESEPIAGETVGDEGAVNRRVEVELVE